MLSSRWGLSYMGPQWSPTLAVLWPSSGECMKGYGSCRESQGRPSRECCSEVRRGALPTATPRALPSGTCGRTGLPCLSGTEPGPRATRAPAVGAPPICQDRSPSCVQSSPGVASPPQLLHPGKQPSVSLSRAHGPESRAGSGARAA